MRTVRNLSCGGPTRVRWLTNKAPHVSSADHDLPSPIEVGRGPWRETGPRPRVGQASETGIGQAGSAQVEPRVRAPHR